MIYLSCNNMASTSAAWNDGVLIEKSTTYTIVADVTTNVLDLYVYFLNGSGEYAYDTSYTDQPVETFTLWAKTGWEGPFTYQKVVDGMATLGNSGPVDVYGSMVQYKAVFKNVPPSVKAIGVYATDEEGTVAGTYYWKCGEDPVYRTIRCYIDGKWQDCIVKYHDGENWVDCTPKYYDGTQWVQCSF